jgi:hypothetical protein
MFISWEWGKRMVYTLHEEVVKKIIVIPASNMNFFERNNPTNPKAVQILRL